MDEEFQKLHTKIVRAYLASESFKRLHPRKWKQFQNDPKIRDAPMPTPEEFQRYNELIGLGVSK